jgi:hypothetical protein
VDGLCLGRKIRVLVLAAMLVRELPNNSSVSRDQRVAVSARFSLEMVTMFVSFVENDSDDPSTVPAKA